MKFADRNSTTQVIACLFAGVAAALTCAILIHSDSRTVSNLGVLLPFVAVGVIAFLGHPALAAVTAVLVGFFAPLFNVPQDTDLINLFPVVLPFVLLAGAILGFLAGLAAEGHADRI